MRIRSISRKSWLAHGFISLWFATGYPNDAPVKSVPLTNKIFEALARPLQDHVAAALNAGEMSQVPAASDPELNKVLNEHLGKILIKKGDSHFTQEANRERRPIEIKGFELRGPTASLVTEADRLNGIEQTVLFSAKGSAYREYDRINGWGKWLPGKPILFSGLKVQLVNGAWQVASSPLPHYRIDQNPES
jgi:hypothetical protein